MTGPISDRKEAKMKTIDKLSPVTALAGALAFTTAQAQQLPTTGTVESPLGKLDLKNGYPTEATAKKIYDDIDFQRACQAYLWALPLMAMQQWQREQREKFGAANLDYVDYVTFEDKLGLLTANATTPYLMAFPNMKDSGPLVVEIPQGATAGGIADFCSIRSPIPARPDRIKARAESILCLVRAIPT
jgi:hypothetical protein